MEQRQALLDWLYWGGQIIISGPNSLEKLRGEFLDAYLPAQYVNNSSEVREWAGVARKNPTKRIKAAPVNLFFSSICRNLIVPSSKFIF